MVQLCPTKFFGLCIKVGENRVVVVYFKQLLGDACTQKLVETFFQPFFNLFRSFQSFFSDFTAEIKKKRQKMNKKVFFFILAKKIEKRLKKMFRPAFGCAQHPKAGGNTQQVVQCQSPC